MSNSEQREPRFRVRRWTDIPNMHAYEYTDDLYDRIVTKFRRLFLIYDEEYEKTLVETQSIRSAVLQPLKVYFKTARFTCHKVLEALLGARIEKGEQIRVARRQGNREVYPVLDDRFRVEINDIYITGKQILYAAFVTIESEIWRNGFGDANEQWVGFINDDE